MSTETDSVIGASSVGGEGASSVALESYAPAPAVTFESPSITIGLPETTHSQTYENPFTLPEYRFDPQVISLDTTQKLPELAFNPDLYQSVVENIVNEERDLETDTFFPESIVENTQPNIELDTKDIGDISLPHASIRKLEIPTTVQDVREKMTFSPNPATTEPSAQSEAVSITAEEIANESVLQESLADLQSLNLPEKEEHKWIERLQRAASPQSGPVPSLAYELTFGEVKPASVEDEQAIPQVKEEVLQIIDEAESVLTVTEEEAEIMDEDFKKKIVQLPTGSWDRYEISDRNQTAEDVQEKRKVIAEKTVNSAVNADGALDAVILRSGLSRLDNHTADEKLRIANKSLQMPDISSQANASLATDQTPDETISKVTKVIAQNEARDHLHEVSARQTIPFEKLDKGAKDVIVNQRVDKVIRPLVWEAADKLPLKNPVEIERSKKAA